MTTAAEMTATTGGAHREGPAQVIIVGGGVAGVALADRHPEISEVVVLAGLVRG